MKIRHNTKINIEQIGTLKNARFKTARNQELLSKRRTVYKRELKSIRVFRDKATNPAIAQSLDDYILELESAYQRA